MIKDGQNEEQYIRSAAKSVHMFRNTIETVDPYRLHEYSLFLSDNNTE